MKTRTKKLAAILTAVVLTAAMAVPAFAADEAAGAVETGANDAAITSMDFDKVVDADDNTYQPAETFKFTVEGATVTDGEEYNNAVVSAGTGTITIADVATDATLKGKQTYDGTIDFSALSLSQPGVYKYTVTETKGSNKDMIYDTTKTLYVYARWKDASDTSKGTEVYGAALTNTAGSTADKSATFTNTYKYNGGDEDEPEFQDLTIKKEVKGTMGDTSKLFDFTLTITSGSNRTTYVVSTTANGSAATLTSGTPYTFSLKHGESIVIENLSALDTYTITETDYSGEGYATEGTVTTAKNMAKTATTETITNTKNAVTPTGIIMNYAPYIAMIGAAVVLAFVFLRRKEEL